MLSKICFVGLCFLSMFAVARAQQPPKPNEPKTSSWASGEFKWKVSQPVLAIDPKRLPQDGPPWISVKDPSVVRYQDRWHLFCTLRRNQEGDGRIRIGYTSFESWDKAQQADWSVLNLTQGYHGAPQVFWFEPHRLWYMIYQATDETRQLKFGPCYSTNADLSKADQWTLPEPLYTVPEGKKAGLDFWVICDDTKAHLFYTTLDGRMWRTETLLANFPNRDWSEPQVALQADIFEASHTYKLKGEDRYVTFVEAQGDRRRYFKAYGADSLAGTWQPIADSPQRPFVSPLNVVNQADSWTMNYSHGELIRSSYNQRLEIDPQHLQLLFQGASDAEYRSNQYGSIPWRLGILEEQLPEPAIAAKVATEKSTGLPRVRVSDDKQFFVDEAGQRFIVWGVNYDHDAPGRLLDEYWEQDWPKVVEDFKKIKSLGANLVRVHLQFGKFMDAPDRANAQALEQLGKLIELSEQMGLYLDITGLACYHKQNIPDWYDELSEEARWESQAVFWKAIAKRCKTSNAVFCYDLMNEPIVSGQKVEKEWLTGELAGKYFTQRISLDSRGRTSREIAAAWVAKLCEAIRSEDQGHLITVGVIPWVFVFGGGEPLFYSPEVGQPLDFASVHFYPEAGKVDAALKALKKYDVGKPLVIEEMFPLKCSSEELSTFVEQSSTFTDGYVSFFWGESEQELLAKPQPTFAEAITAKWLNTFSQLSKTYNVQAAK